MKRFLSILLAVMLLGTAAVADSAPGALTLSEGEPISVDLDGDGAEERVGWTMRATDYEPELWLTVEPEGGAPVEYGTPILWGQSAFVVDLDGDGVREILLTGDEMSDDYVTFCLRYEGGELREILFPDAARGDNGGGYFKWGYGRVTDFGENRVTLSGSQDVLGTWFAERTFALTPLYRFEFADDGLWVRNADLADDDLWEYGALELKAALPYADVDGSPAGALEPGDRILITASDKRETARFVTRDGREGVLAISPDYERGWGLLVNGVPEDELFTFVPYAD